MKIILASSSPRRKELMKLLDIPYEIKVIDHEEIFDDKLDNYTNCLNIAYNKAKLVFDTIDDDVIVIGCDTIVINDDKIFGKPKDYQMAFNMLKSLSGKYHEVVSGVSIIVRKNGVVSIEKEICKTLVFVDEINDEEIKYYIDKCQPFDKAGAYAIQEEFGKYINKIEGDYYNIVGFPINLVYKLLKKYL